MIETLKPRLNGISIRFNSAERRLIRKAARTIARQKRELTVSHFVRQAALERAADVLQVAQDSGQNAAD